MSLELVLRGGQVKPVDLGFNELRFGGGVCSDPPTTEEVSAPRVVGKE